MVIEWIHTIQSPKSQSRGDMSALMTHRATKIRARARPSQPGRPGRSTGRSTHRSTLCSTWGGQVDTMVDPMVDLVSGREFSRPAQFESVFEFRILNWAVLNFKFDSETSEGHNSFIRSTIHANSNTISSRIPRRTQWRNPFPFILSFRINYTLICEA